MTKCIGILLFLMIHLNHLHLSCSVSWWTCSYETVQFKTTYKEAYAYVNRFRNH